MAGRDDIERRPAGGHVNGLLSVRHSPQHQLVKLIEGKLETVPLKHYRRSNAPTDGEPEPGGGE